MNFSVRVLFGVKVVVCSVGCSVADFGCSCCCSEDMAKIEKGVAARE
jgi:hypothetical protein